MSVLDIATEGYLCGPESIATDGYLCRVIVILKKKTGSGGVRAVEVEGYQLTRKQIDQIKREDEELITIITVIGEYLL